MLNIHIGCRNVKCVYLGLNRGPMNENIRVNKIVNDNSNFLSIRLPTSLCPQLTIHFFAKHFSIRFDNDDNDINRDER